MAAPDTDTLPSTGLQDGSGTGLAPGQQLLIYTPDGPLGGTFICVHCRAQAWQPDLLVHAGTCGGAAWRPVTGSVTPG